MSLHVCNNLRFVDWLEEKKERESNNTKELKFKIPNSNSNSNSKLIVKHRLLIITVSGSPHRISGGGVMMDFVSDQM